MRVYLSAIALATLAACTLAQGQEPPLEKCFKAPPLSAKPRVYWYWVNGNMSKAGITADLEAMARVGIGGGVIMEVDCGSPEGPVHTLTPEWNELVQHTIREAKRLGLEISFGNGTGWSGSQGPWVKPEDSMQMTVFTETRVTGPGEHTLTLPRPYANHGFYRDIRVLAFPAPTGEMQVARPVITTASTNVAKLRMGSIMDAGSKTPESLPADAEPLSDGRWDTFLRLPLDPASKEAVITMTYPEPFTARALSLVPGFWQRFKGTLEVSADGQAFTAVRSFDLPSGGPVTQSVRTVSFPPATGRIFRLRLKDAGKFDLAELQLHGGTRLEGWEVRAGLNVSGIPPLNSTPPAADEVIDPARVVDLTSRLDAEGRLKWDVPPGDWVVVRLGHTSCSTPYNTPPTWAQGLETDTMSRDALKHHWDAYMAPILDRAGPELLPAFYTVHTDSWEAGSQNWTSGFAEAFKRLRGYSLDPFLPALTGRIVGSPEQTDRFFWDYRRTIADLVADNYYGGLADLAHSRGMKLSAEAYGNHVIDSYQAAGRADIPMTEIWSNDSGNDPAKNFHVKWGSSPAHVWGKPIVAAESFTTGGKNNPCGSFHGHPSMLKSVGDGHLFAGGVNQLWIHVYAQQPQLHPAVGQTVGGYGFDFNRAQTWWEQSRGWVSYLTRSSALLQQGKPMSDAVYLLTETPRGNGPEAAANLRPLLPAGYDYDAAPAEVLLTRMETRDGRIVLPDGVSYRYLITAPAGRMTLPVLEKLATLVRAGATIVGPRPPVGLPGLSGGEAAETRARALVTELWGDLDGQARTARSVGKGRVIWTNDLAALFAKDGLSPDFASTAPADVRLNSIHRQTERGEDIYFVASSAPAPVEAELAFRVSGRTPYWFFPDTGRIEPVAVWREAEGRTFLPYRFEPSGSVFVVFAPRDGAPAPRLNALRAEGMAEPPRALVREGRIWLENREAGRAVAVRADGTESAVTLPAPPAPLALSRPWEVSFGAPRGTTPEHLTFDRLVSWPDHPNAAVRDYSGTATYEQTVELPASFLAGGRRIELDLGRVEVMAEVRVNGRNLGVVWKSPYRIDVTDALRTGKNKISISVVSTWINRMIADDRLPSALVWNDVNLAAIPDWARSNEPAPDGRVTFTTRRHVTQKDSPVPAGLIGPVRLVPLGATPVP